MDRSHKENPDGVMEIFLAEKLKTSRLMVRVAILNIVIGVTLFIGLTIGCSVSYERSVSSAVTGFCISFLLTGIGVLMLRAFSNVPRGRKVDSSASVLYNSFNLWSLHWNTQQEIRKKVNESVEQWVVVGISLILMALISGSAEVAILCLGLDQLFVYFNWGLYTGLAVLYCTTALLSLLVSYYCSRKFVFLLIFFSVLSLIGSCIGTVVASNVFFARLSKDVQYLCDKGLAENSEGLLYYPLWPFTPLVVSMATPVCIVVCLSLFLILLAISALFDLRNQSGDDDLREDHGEEDVGAKARPLLGILILILGFGVLVSTFSLASASEMKYWDSRRLKQQTYPLFFTFSFLGLAALKFKHSVALPQKLVVCILSAVAVGVSIYFLVDHSSLFVDRKNLETDPKCYNATSDQLCLEQKKKECRTSRSSYCDPKDFEKFCIPGNKICDGLLDFSRNCSTDLSFFCHKYAYYESCGNIDEIFCGTSRFLGFYIFNFSAASVGLVAAAIIAVSNLNAVGDLIKLTLSLLLWLHEPLKSSDGDAEERELALHNDVEIRAE